MMIYFESKKALIKKYQIENPLYCVFWPMPSVLRDIKLEGGVHDQWIVKGLKCKIVNDLNLISFSWDPTRWTKMRRGLIQMSMQPLQLPVQCL